MLTTQMCRSKRRFTPARRRRPLIDRASRPGIIYPHWHQADMAGERLSPADEDIIGTIGDQVAERFGARS